MISRIWMLAALMLMGQAVAQSEPFDGDYDEYSDTTAVYEVEVRDAGLGELTTEIVEDVLSIDRSNFPSFEEWRKMNLEKSGQEDLLGKAAVGEEFDEDDEFDDSGLFTDPNEGKVYKERFNYASFDCAATIMKSNTDTKGALNVLSENKDSYLLNKCDTPNKFVVIELCNDILVDTVSIANYEFFSSMFRKVRLSVSDRFPVHPSSSWKVLGEFEAASVRDIQHFQIDSPQIWARYLQIEFLSHWGHEFYCPVSLVRVHGTTMMDEYRNEESKQRDKRKPRPKIKTEEGSENSTGFNGTGNATASEKEIEPFHGGDAAADIEAETLFPVDDSNTSFDGYNDSMMISSVRVDEMVSPLVLNESYCWDFYLHNRVHNASFATTNTNHTLPNSTVPVLEIKGQQDSIFQTIMKRLQLLESNATLSLKYVEEQSTNLRDVLFKIEKKQNLRIELFFSQFNVSVIEHLHQFQRHYSNLLMDTVVELDRYKKKSDRDILALSSRLTLMADDLVYQKKVGIFQAVILLIILMFVITNRGTPPVEFAQSSPTPHRTTWEYARQIRDWSASGSASPELPLSPARTSFASPIKAHMDVDEDDGDFPSDVDPALAFLHSDSEFTPQITTPRPDTELLHLRSKSVPSFTVSVTRKPLSNDEDENEDGVQSYPTPDTDPEEK